MSKSTIYHAHVNFAREISVSVKRTPVISTIFNHCNTLIEYLEITHGIRLPDGYAVSLSQANANTRRTAFSISSEAIDGIITACDMWKEFIDIVDYDKLVCKEVLAMVQIHSSVISARTFQQDYGILFKKEPSKSFVTIVNNSGNIKVYP